MLDITIERLRELIHYDAETGAFSRLIGPRRDYAVGYTNRRGYVYIHFCGHRTLAHRLAWFYVHGSWPSNHIDHINGNPSDNRISNLRDVGVDMNLQNIRAANRNSQSGLRGAHKVGNKWRAEIYYEGEHHHLGMFDTPEEANAAYLLEKKLRHPGLARV